MTALYMGVSPASDSSAKIETGVYLRMGAYVSDTAEVDEASYFPSNYTDGLDNSDGIFMTSVGSYILTASDDACVEINGAYSQKIADGDHDMTLESGDFKVTMEEKGFVLKGTNKYLIESHHVDGITIEASKGKVSGKGKNIYEHTFGAYLKQVVGTEKKVIKKTSTNVNVAWVYPIYVTAVATTKMASLSMKVVDASFQVLKISSGVLGTSFGYASYAVIPDDTGFAILYIKARGVQLETQAMDMKKEGVKTTLGIVGLHQAISKAGVSGIKTNFGLKAKYPGV